MSPHEPIVSPAVTWLLADAATPPDLVAARIQMAVSLGRGPPW